MPNRFVPIAANSSTPEAITAVNRALAELDSESVVKTFKQAGGLNAIVTGKYADGKYGQVFYDSTGMPRILIGQAPDDGRPGIWITKEGYNVLTELA